MFRPLNWQWRASAAAAQTLKWRGKQVTAAGLPPTVAPAAQRSTHAAVAPLMALPPADPAAATDAAADDKLWRVAGLSPAAAEAARAAARRAGMPLAAWLAGLIHTVAERERAERGDQVPPR